MEKQTPKQKPNIKVPEGFELRISPYSGNWALFPVQGFSKKYLPKNHFVPKRGVNTDENEVTNGESKNSKLRKAKRDKNDEFYTRLDDITCELKYYKEHFKDKTVYCPCDKCFNEGMSKFFVYCAMNFKDLGLKAVIATQYNPNGHGTVKTITAETISELESRGIKWTWHGENGGMSVPDECEIPTEFLEGDGSFDSPECRKIMQECDIVVTNPPFSLFRDFVNQIMELGKKFIIMANQNAITYKEVFSYIKENKMWLGYNNNKSLAFETPNENTKESNRKAIEKMGLDPSKHILVSGVCWFTNLEHRKRKETLYVWKEYNPEEYPGYFNYPAIEVSKVADIPKDYDGDMGVPITFLDKYCPEQFEIIGLGIANLGIECGVNPYTAEHSEYRKNVQHKGAVDGDLYMLDKNGHPLVPYARILIRYKKNEE